MDKKTRLKPMKYDNKIANECRPCNGKRIKFRPMKGVNIMEGTRHPYVYKKKRLRAKKDVIEKESR